MPPYSGSSTTLSAINVVTGNPENILSSGRAVEVYETGNVYGAPRQDAYVPFTGAVPAVLSQDLFVSTDISMYDGLIFEVKAIAGTTPAIKAYLSLDGTLADFAATPVALIDLSTGATIAGATGAVAVGNYLLVLAFKAKNIKLTYTSSVVGATGATIRGGLWKR